MAEFLYEPVEDAPQTTYQPVSQENSIIAAVADTWEGSLMKASPTGYALMKTALDFLPLGWMATKSGRMEFENFPAWQKGLSLGLDALAVGGPVVGKGIKTLASLAKTGKLPFNLGATPRLSPLAKVEVALAESKKVTMFDASSPVEKVAKKFRLTSDEATEVMKTIDHINAPPPEMWYKVSDESGAYMWGTPRSVERLYNKTGGFTKNVSDMIKEWRDIPIEQQMVKHYATEYGKLGQKLGGTTAFEPERLFQLQARKFFGQHADKINFGNAGVKMVQNMILDLLEHPRAVSHLFDPGYAFWTPTTWLPTRKAAGIGEALFKTYTNVYEKATNAMGARNKYEFMKISDLHKRFSDAGFGELKERTILDAKGNPLVNRAEFKPNFNKQEWDDLGLLATQMDYSASSKLSQTERLAAFMKFPEKVQKMYTEVWKPWHDDLWRDHFSIKTFQIFESHGLSQRGNEAVRNLLFGADGKTGMTGRLASYVFNPAHDIGYKAKVAEIDGMLKTVIAGVDPGWFTKRSERLMQKTLEQIKKEFTPRSLKNQDGFINYLDDYAMRVRDHGTELGKLRHGALFGEKAAYSYTRTKKLVDLEDVGRDTSKLIERRARAQASELFLYPEMAKVTEHLKGLPQGYKDYFEHWISRMMGESSATDNKMATWLTSTIGGIEAKWFGGKGVWDGKRVMELGHRVNDLVYMGALGLKPFAAIKNLFQTLLTVPTDMGGIKDLYWMTRGFKRGIIKETRDYITSIGAIQEYAPEIYLRSRTVQFGPNIKGVQLPTGEKLRDVMMWQFQNADKFNRYVTGGAVLEKWDHYARKFLTNEHWSPKNFMDKLNFHKRDDWIQDRLKAEFAKLPTTFRSGDDVAAALSEAKKIFVKDVIADTQFLYGIPDSPTITSKYGAISRTGLIFQTFWMNYMSSMEKWFRGAGRLDRNIDLNRFMTWMTSSAIAGSMMHRGLQFSAGTTGNMILLGPLPTEFNEFAIPPTFAPIYYSLASVLQTVNQAGEYTATGEWDGSAITRRLKALGRSTFMFFPAGQFVEQSVKRSLDEGWQGFAKSLIGARKGD